MKLVYTNENRLLVGNAKNILEAQDIELLVKNEFASGAMGEISPFDTWLELWVLQDTDYDKAVAVLATALSEKNSIEWTCDECKELNDASFEFCWQCQRIKNSELLK